MTFGTDDLHAILVQNGACKIELLTYFLNNLFGGMLYGQFCFVKIYVCWGSSLKYFTF